MHSPEMTSSNFLRATMDILDSFPFERLLWLVPIFFMLHNMEEAPFMEAWSKQLPLKIHPTVTTRQFVIAVTLLTLGGFLLTFLGLEVLPQPVGYLIILGIQMVLAFNAFVPHLLTTIRFRLYSPGLVTALVVTLPFSLYLFSRALTEGLLTRTQCWILLAIAPFAMVAFAYLSLQAGKFVESKKWL